MGSRVGDVDRYLGGLGMWIGTLKGWGTGWLGGCGVSLRLAMMTGWVRLLAGGMWIGLATSDDDGLGKALA